MSMTKDKTVCCAGCGKQVEGPSFRVARGSLSGQGFKEKSQWGCFHTTCFAQVVQSPDLVMQELKQAAAG